MVNYYRRLVGSGWAPDKKDYAPTATKMTAVTYDCDTVGKAVNDIQNVCTLQTYTPTQASYSLSYQKESNLTMARVDVLQKAIKKWANELKLIDLDKKVTFAGDVETNAKDFAYMVNEAATKVGCAVKDCKAQGFTLAICQYDATLAPDDTVYTTGKPCSGCNALGKTCDNALGGGLCK